MENQIIQMEKDSKEAKSDKDISKVSDNNKKAKRCKYFNVGLSIKRSVNLHTQKKFAMHIWMVNVMEKVWVVRIDILRLVSGCKREDACEFSHDTHVCGNWKKIC